MSPQLQDLNEKLTTEFAELSAAFCRDSIFNNRSFNATCKFNFSMRLHCEEHGVWHVIPARKRKPWRLVSDMEEFILDALSADESVVHLQKAFWDVRGQHKALFALLEEIETNALNARREQNRRKAKADKGHHQPPKIAAEFIPRPYLIEFSICYRKTQYESEREAKEAIYELHRNEIEKMSTYKCQYCSNFHVGHRQRRKPSPATVFNHAKKYWREYPKQADQFVVERNLLLG